MCMCVGEGARVCLYCVVVRLCGCGCVCVCVNAVLALCHSQGMVRMVMLREENLRSIKCRFANSCRPMKKHALHARCVNRLVVTYVRMSRCC